MSVDLHMHSTASDGTLTPARLVKRAVRRGVRVMALTDHDTTAGLLEAHTEAASHSIDLIPGIEINTEDQGLEVHVLGYFIDPADAALQQALATVREQRLVRIETMLQRLAAAGVSLSLEDVLRHARGSTVGRPHIALALVEKKAVGSVHDAFKHWLGRGGAAYVPRASLTPYQAIDLIHGAGGVAVLAHPCHVGGEEAIAPYVRAGLDGLEAHYLQHTPTQVALYLQLAQQWNLAVTGGSDFHGPQVKRKVDVGDNRFSLEDLRAFCTAVGREAPRLARLGAALPQRGPARRRALVQRPPS